MTGEIVAEAPVAGFVAPVVEIVDARHARRNRNAHLDATRHGGPGTVIQLPPRTSWSPAVNVFDTGKAFIVIAELAGVGPDSLRIELDVERYAVTLRGTRAGLPPQVSWGVDMVDEEIVSGAFEREIVLGEPIDARGARAVCRYGMLELMLPKQGGREPKRAPVRPNRRAVAC